MHLGAVVAQLVASFPTSSATQECQQGRWPRCIYQLGQIDEVAALDRTLAAKSKAATSGS